MRVAAAYSRTPITGLHTDEVYVAGVDGVPHGWGELVKEALRRTAAEVLVIDPPEGGLEALVNPIGADALDVVVGQRRRVPLTDWPLNRLAAFALSSQLYDVGSLPRAFRVSALAAEGLRRDDLSADAEALMRLSAQRFRFGSAMVDDARERTAQERAQLLAAWGRYATVQDDADNQHEGYASLRSLEAGAPNYNRWLAQTFAPHAGQRVLEIGAGIGTITAQLAEGRELVTALEVDPFYVRRLKNRFRGQPNVEPLLGDVAMADWRELAERKFDTIVLSNVLEHIADDGEAVRTFARILPPGGRLIIYVPALPAVYGAIDEAVGHHRRYLPGTLRTAIEGNGFELTTLRWMNVVGIPGWYVNGKLLRRRSPPPLQLRIYDAVAPWLARAESMISLPIGNNLLAVGRRR